MTQPAYRLRGVQAHYQSRVALSVDELGLACGCLNVIAGANGSGKSTLLNVLAFLLKPAAGTVEFCGHSISWQNGDLQTVRRQVTLVHQEPFLFRGSVGSNVSYGPQVRGIRGHELRDRVRESLALVGLPGFESRHANRLSGGEGRRVALARALACHPEVMLLDEPLAYADPASTEIIEQLLVTVVERGVLVVVSSHDPTLGSRLRGRTIRLQQGKIVLGDQMSTFPDISQEGGSYALI